MTITLPWAPRALWPNGRPPHWAVRAKAAARQRRDAAVVCAAARLPWTANPFARARVTLTFCSPPRTARYDLDGALASQKHALDAIAEAIGVDDSRFELVLERGEKGSEGKAGGVRVDVEMLPETAWQSIGNVASRFQEGLRHSAGDDKEKSGAGGATNAIRPLTITDLAEGGQDGC